MRVSGLELGFRVQELQEIWELWEFEELAELRGLGNLRLRRFLGFPLEGLNSKP